MDSAQCPLCSGRQLRKAFAERGYDVLQCAACELFFIHPYPNDQDQFQTVAEYDYDGLEIVSTERHYRSSGLFYAEYFPLIEREIVGARAVLDVGCGTGHLLELLGRNPQLQRVGLELNSERAQFARQKAGCEIHQTPIEQFQSDVKFDGIFLMNLLSHVPRIDGLFEAVRRLLSDRGRVILKVGEMSSSVKKHAVHDWDIPDHLHFLGLKTMDVICERFGFRKVTHLRKPLSSELFARSTWQAQGRSNLRNAVKRAVLATPGALPTLAKIYDVMHGQSFYTSFISLELDQSSNR